MKTKQMFIVCNDLVGGKHGFIHLKCDLISKFLLTCLNASWIKLPTTHAHGSQIFLSTTHVQPTYIIYLPTTDLHITNSLLTYLHSYYQSTY
jgi:hypothetical protein